MGFPSGNSFRTGYFRRRGPSQRIKNICPICAPAAACGLPADPLWIWRKNYSKLGLAKRRGLLLDHLRGGIRHFYFSLFVSLWAAQGRSLDQKIQSPILRFVDPLIGIVVSGGKHPARGLRLYGQPLPGLAIGHLVGLDQFVFCRGKRQNHLYSAVAVSVLFTGFFRTMGSLSSE